MAMIGAIMSVASGVVGAMGTIAAGKAQVAAAKAERKQLAIMAAEKQAVATREAQDKGREVKMLQSRSQAVAAASGAGATDPTVMELAGNIARYGNTQTRELVRQGQEEAKMLNYKGLVGVKNAQASAKVATLGAIGQVVGGFTSAFQNYGSGLPSVTTNTANQPWYG